MRRIVILGGGESGYGSAILARTKGFDTFLSDSGPIAPKYAAKLKEYDIPYEQNGHTPELILNADLIIKSPGIPEKAPIIKAAREKGIKIVSEIEFAGHYAGGRAICITGSNGKTTTTTLIYRILCTGGYDVAIGGNIGESFAYTVATQDRAWYVLELSSFQLDDMYDFKAHIGVLMNITPDHLDRYGYVFQNYVDSKFRIIRNQGPNETFIYCADDATSATETAKRTLPMQVLPFSARNRQCPGATLSDEGIFTAQVGERTLSIDMNKVRIKGLHNAYDTMAAVLAAMSAGVSDEAIEKTVYEFEGIEHRLEYVVTVNDVEYINDSKATNVDSVWYALESMRKPTIWIAGGTDKGNDYDPLKEFARAKVKALVCMGIDNTKLVENFTTVVPRVFDTHSLDDAMKVCAQIAKPGDAVLLSPACASFDLFENYEDRGMKFKRKIKELETDEERKRNG